MKLGICVRLMETGPGSVHVISVQINTITIASELFKPLYGN